MLLLLAVLLVSQGLDLVGSQAISCHPNDAKVVLRCQSETGDNSGEVKWFKGESEIPHTAEEYEVRAEGLMVEGTYRCENAGAEHVFHLKVRVCDGCFEFSGFLASGVIVSDLLLTGGVVLLVSLLTLRGRDTHHRDKNTAERGTNPQSRHAPQPPNRDYEALDRKTANHDIYTGLR